VANQERRCIKKPQHCPYEGCGGGSIWFWGWYYRKGGNIPCGESEVCGKLPIRRFKCTGCRRTFSWRPSFLVFGRRFPALVYEQLFEPGPTSTLAWWQPGEANVKAVRRKLRQHAQRVIRRLETHLKRRPTHRADVNTMLTLARTIALQQSAHQKSRRYSSHILFLSLAATRARAEYSLTAT
jgi:transposase